MYGGAIVLDIVLLPCTLLSPALKRETLNRKQKCGYAAIQVDLVYFLVMFYILNLSKARQAITPPCTPVSKCFTASPSSPLYCGWPLPTAPATEPEMRKKIFRSMNLSTKISHFNIVYSFKLNNNTQKGFKDILTFFSKIV